MPSWATPKPRLRKTPRDRRYDGAGYRLLAIVAPYPKFGPSVLIPSYRHPMAQASAIATLDQIAPGRLMVGFGTGFTGRAGMGKKPLSLASMRTHITQVRLCGAINASTGAVAAPHRHGRT